MDALLLRLLQGYLRDTFGAALWKSVCRRAELSIDTFEPLLRYEPGLADRVAGSAADLLGRSVEAVWEDMGTYLVTNPGHEGVRRLLRFGGTGFADFLHSLEELPGRARLALPDLELPDVSLTALGSERYLLRCPSAFSGMSRILVGMLTAMADDYGALCVIEPDEEGCIVIRILDSRHNAAKAFELAMPEQ